MWRHRCAWNAFPNRVENVAIFAAAYQAAGQRRPPIASLAGGGMTAGTSLVEEPLTGRDGCRVGPEWIARGIRLLRRHCDRERGDRTNKKCKWTEVHHQAFYHRGGNSQLPTTNYQPPTPNCQLPTPNSQLRTPTLQPSNFKFQLSNCQFPTPNPQGAARS